MENIQPNYKFNIRNGKNLYPYQCSSDPAIRDLFYRTYVVSLTKPEHPSPVGIDKFSLKLKHACNQYRKIMIQKLIHAQEQCEKEKAQILSLSSIEKRICQCTKGSNCPGCQKDHCQNISTYYCLECKKFLFCDKCFKHNVEDHIKKHLGNNRFIRIRQIPLDFSYNFSFD